MGGRPLTRAVVGRINELHSQNLSLPEIARRCGVSYNGVRRHVDEDYHENQNTYARKSYKPRSVLDQDKKE